MSEDPPDPTRVVADADILVADVLVGADARAALDVIRAHSWLDLVASEPLLDEAQALIAELADEDLARAWRTRIDRDVLIVQPTMGGHPAVTAAAAGSAATVLSFHEGLQSAGMGAAIRPIVATSVKSPAAFHRLLDPAALYRTLTDEAYPGPDLDPRG